VPPALIVLAGDLDSGLPGLTTDPAAVDTLLGATMDLARRVGGVGRVLLFSPPEAEGRLAARTLGFRLWPAEGATAGERFGNAFRQAGELGYDGGVVIGLGVPDLPPERLTEAAAMLEQHQGVLAEDGRGGIALLGLQGAEATLFTGDTDVPDAETIRTRCRQQLVRLVELDPHPALTAETVDDFLASRQS
jgi:glycosyltransferase A (GT-A) superfamily protein (DUF2064 family)